MADRSRRVGPPRVIVRGPGRSRGASAAGHSGTVALVPVVRRSGATRNASPGPRPHPGGTGREQHPVEDPPFSGTGPSTCFGALDRLRSEHSVGRRTGWTPEFHNRRRGDPAECGERLGRRGRLGVLLRGRRQPRRPVRAIGRSDGPRADATRCPRRRPTGGARREARAGGQPAQDLVRPTTPEPSRAASASPTMRWPGLTIGLAQAVYGESALDDDGVVTLSDAAPQEPHPRSVSTGPHYSRTEDPRLGAMSTT